jgi:hypothetical protein
VFSDGVLEANAHGDLFGPQPPSMWFASTGSGLPP